MGERAKQNYTILQSVSSPDTTIPWLPKYASYSINIVPHSRTGKVPRACWGDIVELYKTPKVMNSMEPRSLTCIALAPSGNSTGSWFFLSLNSGSVVKGHRWSDRKFDELALKTISDMNRRFKTGKITEKASATNSADLIQEPAQPIFQNRENLDENEKSNDNKDLKTQLTEIQKGSFNQEDLAKLRTMVTCPIFLKTHNQLSLIFLI